MTSRRWRLCSSPFMLNSPLVRRRCDEFLGPRMAKKREWNVRASLKTCWLYWEPKINTRRWPCSSKAAILPSVRYSRLMQVHGLSEKSISRPCVMGSAFDSIFIKDMSGSTTITQTFQEKAVFSPSSAEALFLRKFFAHNEFDGNVKRP